MAKQPVASKRRRVPLVPGADRYTPFILADVMAVKALAAGTANEDQQRRAFAWIVNDACQTYHTSYAKGDPGETAFNEGRRFPGLELVKLVKCNPEELKRTSDE